jgi:hypothetical protein
MDDLSGKLKNMGYITQYPKEPIFPYTEEEEVDEFVKNKRLFFREVLAHRIKLA